MSEQAVVRAKVQMGARGVELRSMDDLARFAEMVHASGLAPKGFANPQAVAVAVQLGLELGLSAMAAVQNIAVINGRPGIYGDAALALVRDSGLCQEFREWYEVGDREVSALPAKITEDCAAVCYSHRRGDAEGKMSRFSWADAVRAKLSVKDLYQQYPQRMLKFRARGFCLRDLYPDVLKGIRTLEELSDMPAEPGSRTEAVAQKLAARQLAARLPGMVSAAPGPETAAEAAAIAAEGQR